MTWSAHVEGLVVAPCESSSLCLNVGQLARGAGRRSTAGALPRIGPLNVNGLGHAAPDASWNGIVVGAQALAGEPQRSHIFRVLSVSCNTPDGVGQRTRVEAGAGRGLVESVYSSDVLWILHFKSYDAGIVSRSTATGLLYPAVAFAPWMVREPGPPAPHPPRLLDRVREAIRARHYSRRTEKAYVHWIRRFIFFHDKRHPADMGAVEVSAFLTSLAVRDKVAASTQNQARSALLFLYREVLGVELPWLDDVVRAKRPQYLPVVLTRDETRAVLQRLNGVPRVMGLLLYGGPPSAGVLPPAREGRQLCDEPDRDPRRQGAQGSALSASGTSAFWPAARAAPSSRGATPCSLSPQRQPLRRSNPCPPSCAG